MCIEEFTYRRQHLDFREYRSAYTIMARETAPGGANETMFVNRSSTLGTYQTVVQVRGLAL